MEIKEKNIEVILDTLASRIKTLELDLWMSNNKVVQLSAEIERLKGGASDGKA